MRHYGASLKEIQEEWTLHQALEFGTVAVATMKQQRISSLHDMVHAYAATQSKEGNKGFQKLVRELEK